MQIRECPALADRYFHNITAAHKQGSGNLPEGGTDKFKSQRTKTEKKICRETVSPRNDRKTSPNN